MTPEELWDALDGLHAYDQGALDSGIHDEDILVRCVAELRSMPTTVARVFLARRLREAFLSEEALEAGYGPMDVVEFMGWLDYQLGRFPGTPKEDA